ncbi:MAG: alkaline phosphatase family protein [Phycisphaerales bacterium]|nr:alkaline phosphatase family protein [Phycisphaerales bacterium]
MTPSQAPIASPAASAGPFAGGAVSRPLRAVADRVLIVGLDGATFDVLDPLMERGRMPNLKRFIAEGVAGTLMSTRPPITPAAWTTFMTGKGPGKHGILDFEKYDPRRHELSFNSTYEIREKTIWELLSEKGLRVGSVNVPMTYPPKPINGFMVSGFETPSVKAEFTWPPELKQDIFRILPNYNYRTNWKRKALGGDDVLRQNLEYICNSFDQGWTLTQHCGEAYGWDVLMVVFKLVDNLQHKAWKYLDPRTAPRYGERAEWAAECFKRLDDALGKLLQYAQDRGATVMIMSDHGHGSLEGKAQPNLLLKRWGFLTLRSPWEQAGQRAAHWVRRLTKGKVTRFEQGSRGIESELAVDWSRTRACVMHAGIYGFLYLNLKGRQPHGIVDPRDYDRVRDELVERFTSATAHDRHGREIRIFPEVYRTEQLYGCRRDENPDLPDLLLSPMPGLAVVRKIRGGRAVRWSSEDRMEGTHRVEGIFAMGGPNVKRGARVNAEIADMAPTLLAALGLPVPVDMEGRVLRDPFTIEPVVEREPPVKKVMEEHGVVYSEQDKKILEKRLSELGYLE